MVTITLPKLAREPDLIAVILADIQTIGVVGEQEAALFLYLCGTSRILDNPLKVIIRGNSSSGKSWVQKCVSDLFPEEAILRVTTMTPESLYYNQVGSLKNMWIVKGERSRQKDEKAQDASAALRQLLSENKISKLSTDNKAEGGPKGKYIVQEGPVAFCETTTLEDKDIFEEDSNRMIHIFMDDSIEQSERIIEEIARRDMAETSDDEIIKEIITNHKRFQRSLKPYRVIVPFSGELAKLVHKGNVTIRRTFTQIESTIKAITLLHQHTRKRDKRENLVATLDDYMLARKALLPSLQRIDAVSKGARSLYEALEEFKDTPFNTHQAQEKGNLSNRKTPSKLLKELRSLKVVELVKASVGSSPAIWRIIGKLESVQLLPTVENGKLVSVTSRYLA
jgi:hypothetical protein